jgi:hypothetical protein
MRVPCHVNASWEQQQAPACCGLRQIERERQSCRWLPNLACEPSSFEFERRLGMSFDFSLVGFGAPLDVEPGEDYRKSPCKTRATSRQNLTKLFIAGV